mmetsp:Transcript_35555/g.36236  ORF Transcript_35555/g.36236 Transcript_35555/m.36236 type:complete len:296 (+) Transcript_35555:174-1061(+)
MDSAKSPALLPLVALDPPDILTFTLVRDTSPKTILKVTNTSNAKVAFKIKTTQPTWYYVRPNQQIIDANKTEEVTIVLVDTECNKFLDQVSEDKADMQLDKHRFLVQSKIIDDSTFEKISALPHNLRSDEYTKIWDGGKDDRKNQKLKVELIVPPNQGDGSTSNGASNSVSEAMENVRKRLPKVDSTASASKLSQNAPPEAIFSELQNLRKKYDAVVEYTVHLTAERDFHFSQLEELKRELTREKTRKKGTETTKGGKLNEKSVDKKGTQQGFSLFVLILFALLSFLCGRYFQSK